MRICIRYGAKEITALVYNTVVRLCQFFCCGGKVDFVRIPYSHDRFSKISRTFFLKNWFHIKPTYKKTNSFLLCMDLQSFRHDCFSKISRTLFDFLNNTCWVSLFLRNNSLIFRTGASCFSVTLFYFTLFCCGRKANLVWFTLRNLPTLRVGWRNLFSSCAVVSVFCSGGK